LGVEEENIILTADQLANPDLAMTAAVALGAIALAAIKNHGCVTFFVSLEGKVEFCPPWESALDSVESTTALRTLLDRDYTDEQLENYLRGRAARLHAAETAK
jgi:hypothetical protein